MGDPFPGNTDEAGELESVGSLMPRGYCAVSGLPGVAQFTDHPVDSL